ncbi:MAG: DMT family transporter [Gammaproteobacteria bacterium]|nr:DMT family transporter [Gammaproteobacteria bacterium]
MLAGKESTSGYWWSRHWILSRLQSTETNLSFSEISIIEDDARKILLKVMCDPDTVAAGALAEFRFSSRIDDNGNLRNEAGRRAAQDCGAKNDARLRIIQRLEEIPNGAYVLGAQASKEQGLARDLVDVWQQAVNRLYIRAANCAEEEPNECLRLASSTPITEEKIERYLPRNWLPRKLHDYTDGFIEAVFNIDDPNTSSRSRTIYFLLIVCAVILVIGLSVVLLLQWTKSNVSSGYSRGIAFALLATFTSIGATLAPKYVIEFQQEMNIFVFILISNLFTTLLSSIRFSYRREAPMPDAKKRGAITGIWLGITSFAGFAAFLKAIHLGPLSIVAAVSSLYILIPIVLSVILHKESWRARSQVALFLSLLGIVLCK